MRTNASQLTLYSTDGCHLCHEASNMLAQLDCQFQVVDIAYDDELFHRYGVTIPVLKFGINEINWPFSLEQLQIWLKQHGFN